jgi:hypothetical protein
MAAKKRTRGEREADMVNISQLYIQGWSHQAITNKLNAERHYTLTRSQISHDIQCILDRWRKAYLVDVNEAQIRELARLDELENQYWQAWERSQHDAIITQEIDIKDELSGGQSYTRKKRVLNKEKQTGQDSYLLGIQRCIELRCKILGLDAPAKVEIDWRTEAVKMGIDPDEMFNSTVQQISCVIEKSQKSASPLLYHDLLQNNIVTGEG